jgi:hypothetical protein
MKPHITIKIIKDEKGKYFFTMFGHTFILPYKIPVREFPLSEIIEMGLELDMENL